MALQRFSQAAQEGLAKAIHLAGRGVSRIVRSRHSDEARAIEEGSDESLEHRHVHRFVEADNGPICFFGQVMGMRRKNAQRDQESTMSMLTTPALGAFDFRQRRL